MIEVVRDYCAWLHLLMDGGFEVVEAVLQLQDGFGQPLHLVLHDGNVQRTRLPFQLVAPVDEFMEIDFPRLVEVNSVNNFRASVASNFKALKYAITRSSFSFFSKSSNVIVPRSSSAISSNTSRNLFKYSFFSSISSRTTSSLSFWLDCKALSTKMPVTMLTTAKVAKEMKSKKSKR
eukprot:CAMPEP_0115394050 /NCGR_PEP_ID=MMETSP0271-20121206/12065_1 /TAXON_ID=71861 /ORGANISM="Scrippsiella trochoidea, Strain CCMP3099" /LENGTH=176 /DNA_ID=CAMNT_0002817707 /DNA_START=111 /DNA_END=642 /DNA_ORIENTATION=+